MRLGIMVALFAVTASLGLAAPDVHAGLGVWVWEISKCEGGNIEAIVAKAKAAHLGHVLIRVTSNGDRWAKFNSKAKVYALARGLKAEGIRVYAWGYHYPFAKNPKRQKAQISLVKQVLGDSAFDGYVYNVETEFAGHMKEAEALMRPVKKFRDAKHPDKLLGYSTYCRIDRGRGAQMPVLQFNRWNDVAMPQAYWRDFNWSPRHAAVRMCSTWLEKEQAWRKQGIADAARPLFPTAHAYNGEGATQYISPEELACFLDATDGYFGVNVWSWQHMAPEHWEVLETGAANWLAKQVEKPAIAKTQELVPESPNMVAPERPQTSRVSWIGIVFWILIAIWLLSGTFRAYPEVVKRAPRLRPWLMVLLAILGGVVLFLADILSFILWLASLRSKKS